MSKLSGSSSQTQQMKPDDLITFIIEEAQHHVISDECSKNAKSALAAHAKKGKGKAGKKKKHNKSNKTDLENACENCGKPAHVKPDCWLKGGGKEGQGPNKRGPRKERKPRWLFWQ